MKATTFAGSMNSGDIEFDQAKYDEIRTANYKVTETYSTAITTPSLKTMPSSYLIAGTGATIEISATIPTKDIVGTIRPITDAAKEVTLGAYQYTTPVGLDAVVNQYAIYGSNASIVINGANGKTALLYGISGELIKSVKITSNQLLTPCFKGFYIVSIGSEKSKVFVR